MNERPTKKQKELLNFIDSFIKGNGYGPSYREVMRALDYKSVSTVATHIDGLIARGWLVKKDHSARSLTVVGQSGTSTSQEVAPKSTMASVGIGAEKVIRDKIESLKTEGIELRAEEIEILQRTLEILGYTAAAEEHLA